MQICFSARQGNNNFTPRLFNNIIKNSNKDIKAVFITLNAKETKHVKKILIKEAKVLELGEFVENVWDDISADEFSIYESKYNCAPIWKYVYTDRFLVNCEYEYIVKTVVAHFKFFESIFQDPSTGYYYDEAIATLHSYVGYLVATYYGVQYISQMLARGNDAKYHYFLADPHQHDINFRDNYLEISYSEEIRKKAEEYLNIFENVELKPRYMIFSGKRPKLFPDSLKAIALYLKGRFDLRYNNKYVYMLYKGYKSSLESIVFYFRYQKSKKYYKKADYGKKYIYFPLHYQPEASTLVCAEKYEKQIFYIDSWAKSLPADTLLYVKEHYAKLGHRESAFYKQLGKYPNVILIDPWESSRKLMQNSVAVTTLTGTAGFEAMLLRKPVILGGKIFFDNAPGVCKIDDIYGNYISLINSWKEPSRNDILQYLCEYFTSISEGNANYADPLSLEDENLDKLAKSVLRQIESLK